MFPIIFLTIFSLIRSVSSIKDRKIDFSLEYFQIKNVKHVCLIACEEKKWDVKFAKKAMESSIAVSSVTIHDSSYDFGSVISCLTQFTSTGVLMDTKCAVFEDVLLLGSEKGFFDANHQWLITDDDERTNNMTGESDEMEINEKIAWLNDTFNKLNLSVDADITLSIHKGSRNIIYEVYNFGKIRGANVIISKLGTWEEKPELLSELKRYKYYRRWDFEQSTINFVAVMSTPPKEFDLNMIIGNQDKKGVAIMTVTGVLILEELRELHNSSNTFMFLHSAMPKNVETDEAKDEELLLAFNYTIMDRWIGGFERNSTRVAANALYFKEQDLTPLLRVAPEVFRRVDFLLPPLTSIETRYYYRIPTAGAGKFENQFLRPLTPGVWSCVIAVTVLCGLTLYLAAKAEHRPSAAQYALFSVIATFCQQFFEDGGTEDPRRESSARQLSVFVTGTSCLLIYNYYTSSVVSWLLNGPPPSINSLEELLESPLSLIFEDIGYTRSWLQNPKYYYNKKNAEVEDKLRTYKVFNKKKGSPLLVPLEEGIEMVKAGGYAYHTEAYSANSLISKTFTQEELCELGSLQSMENTHLYAAVPKNSPYKEFFNWNLIRFYETGIVSHFQRINRNPGIACEGSSPRALALGGAAPAFLLLALGFFLSAVILLIERCMKRNNKAIRISNAFVYYN